MFDAMRDRLAWGRARKLVRKRAVRPWHPDPAERRVLLVLPANEADARPAWRFVSTLGLDPERTLPVVPTGEIAYAPVDFLGRVMSLNQADLGRLGLPRRRYLKEAWAFDPDVAMALTHPFDLASALIVGASPAAFRIGFTGEGADPFFDLMMGGDNIIGGLRALSQTIERIEPPLLAPSVPSESRKGVRPAW